jgi:hypothetical protein
LSIANLLKGALQQLLSAKMPAWLWGLAALLYMLPGIMMTYLDSDDHAGWIAGLLIPWLVAFIALYWFLTRGIGHATSREEGSFGAWFGWSTVAAIPMVLLLIAAIGIFGADDSGALDQQLPWWVQSLTFSMALALPVPFLVHSVGRAIDRDGPALGVVWARLKPHYFLIVAAYFITLLPSVLGDAATGEFGADYGNGASYAANAFGWLCYFVQFLLSTALLAFVWRSTVAVKPG